MRPPIHRPQAVSAAPWETAEELRDRARLRACLAGSVLFHLALLSVTVPGLRRLPLDEPPAPPAIFRLEDFRIRPPEPPPVPTQRPARPEARTVPVPELLIEDPVPVEPSTRIAPLPVILSPTLPVLAPPPPVPESAPLRFGAGMTRPLRLSGPDPAYTEVARRARRTGIVVLEAVIDRDGSVRDVKVLRDLGFGLTEAAVNAVRRWRFEPATLDGRPVAVLYNLTVRFDLR